MCDFVGQSLVQQHATFGLTTDLAQSWKANLGPLQSELAHPKATDPVGLCIAQFDKISRQQQEPSQPTAATSSSSPSSLCSSKSSSSCPSPTATDLAAQQSFSEHIAIQPGIMLEPTKSTTTLDAHALDITQSGQSGSYVVEQEKLPEGVTLQDIERTLIATSKLLAQKADEQSTAGNTVLAQELLGYAQYAAECAKTFGQSLNARIDELIKNSPLLHELINLHSPNKPQQELPAIEQQYNGIVQECCARCGKLAPDIILAVLTHKASASASGTIPPTTILPEGAIAVAPVAVDGQVATMQKAGVGLALMAGGPQDQQQTKQNPVPEGTTEIEQGNNVGKTEATEVKPADPQMIAPENIRQSLQNQTIDQLYKSRESYENLINQHEAKLEAYKKNPDLYDNKGLLQNVAPVLRDKIIQGRIKALQKTDSQAKR